MVFGHIKLLKVFRTPVNMGIFHFPSNFVYWENVENHQEIKRIFLNEIRNIRVEYKNNKGGILNGSTSYNPDNFDLTILDFLRNNKLISDKIIWNPINNAIKQINIQRSQNPINITHSIISTAWYTEYDEGGSFDYHTHLNHSVYTDNKIYIPSFSIIYILNDENKCNATTFMNPTSMYVSTEELHECKFKTGDINEIKEGTVLIFPSSLYHCVQNVKIPGRITIAINVYSSHS